MKSKGLKPIPVFHQMEDFKWLYRMLDDGEPYLGISPTKGSDRHEYRRWLDKVFTILTDKDGWPIVKTHGLRSYMHSRFSLETWPKIILHENWIIGFIYFVRNSRQDET